MIEEKERIKMSFGFAGDVVKQLIALSTAIVTLCIVLTDKLFSSEAAHHHYGWLLAALVLFVISILCGLVTMMAITGTLGKPEDEKVADDKTTDASAHEVSEPQKKDLNKGTIYQSNITLFMYGQTVTFLLAIVLSVVFLFVAACSDGDDTTKAEKPREETGKGIQVQRISSFTVIDSMRVDTIKVDME